MNAALATYGAYAALSFQRMFAYRVANLAGLFTNTFFLLFRAYALSAFYVSNTQVVGGLNVKGVQSYVTITQSLIMVIPQWGAFDIGEGVRSGQIAMDLSRPASIFGMYMSKQLGRSAYYVLARCIPVLVIGLLFGFLTPLQDWWRIVPCLISIVLGAWIVYTLFFIVEATSFWLESDRGPRWLFMGLLELMGGLFIPVSFLPDWALAISKALPFQYTMNAPVAIYLGNTTGLGPWDMVMVQTLWATGLSAVCIGMVSLGTRRLVIHGG